MNNCPKCGSSVKTNQIFCSSCGSRLFDNERNLIDHPNQIDNDTVSNNQQLYQEPQYNRLIHQDNIATDEELVSEYIGRNAKYFSEEGFSFCTFFFGVIYVFYRQMNFLGFIWLVISFITTLFLPSFYKISPLIINLIMAIYFKKLYLRHCREKVKKIKNENLDKSKEELLDIMRRRGGTSISAVLLILLIYGSVVYFAFSATIELLYKSMEKTAYDMINDLNITIPEGFNETSYSTITYKAYEKAGDNLDNCLITIQISNQDNNNKDVKRFLDTGITRFKTDNYSGVQEQLINNNTWYYASLSNQNIEKYYYSINYNKKLYKITYTINSDVQGTCHSSLNQIVSSLWFKDE